MQHLHIEGTRLEAAAAAIHAIGAEFDDTDTMVSMVTEALGSHHDTHLLRDAVEDFAGNWRTRRASVREEVLQLGSVVQTVHDSFAALDVDLAGALTAGPQGPTVTTAPPRAV